MRDNRPHVYLTQRPGACERCGGSVPERIVRDEAGLAALRRCARCGEQQTRLDEEPLLTLAASVARAQRDGAKGERPPEGAFARTTSTCPRCLRLVDAEVVHRAGCVFFEKRCPDCGPSAALVSEDVGYYLASYLDSRAGSEPLRRFATASRGCPEDCGLCPDHEQHTCLPVVEVTDHCELDCPICLVDNERAHHLEPEAFGRMVDGLLAAEGRLESLALSGGEPTSHPQFWDLVSRASDERIGRIVLLTNGLRIARDRPFADELRRRGVYVSLQFDGDSERASVLLRGRDLREQKRRALSVLRELDIPTQLVFTAVRGVNEELLGDAVRLLLAEPHVLSLNVQPAAFTGHGGGRFPFDPLDRLTIPGVLRAIEQQTEGLVRSTDFAPLPCPEVHCVALGYLLRLDDGRHLPFARFADLREHGALLRNSATLPALPEIEQALRDVAYELYAREQESPEAPAVLAALRRVVREMFPGQPLSQRELVRAGERQAKSIFVHHYMDAHDFDLARLRKCCHHYPQTDGRLMPMCGFNLFHRGAAIGAGSPRAPWGRGPWPSGAEPSR